MKNLVALMITIFSVQTFAGINLPDSLKQNFMLPNKGFQSIRAASFTPATPIRQAEVDFEITKSTWTQTPNGYEFVKSTVCHKSEKINVYEPKADEYITAMSNTSCSSTVGGVAVDVYLNSAVALYEVQLFSSDAHLTPIKGHFASLYVLSSGSSNLVQEYKFTAAATEDLNATSIIGFLAPEVSSSCATSSDGTSTCSTSQEEFFSVVYRIKD